MGNAVITRKEKEEESGISLHKSLLPLAGQMGVGTHPSGHGSYSNATAIGLPEGRSGLGSKEDNKTLSLKTAVKHGLERGSVNVLI